VPRSVPWEPRELDLKDSAAGSRRQSLANCFVRDPAISRIERESLVGGQTRERRTKRT
jgi:hypothetical protein